MELHSEQQDFVNLAQLALAEPAATEQSRLDAIAALFETRTAAERSWHSHERHELVERLRSGRGGMRADITTRS